jgi:hypothetical protein
MNHEMNQQPQAEQLLKMLELQMAASRERRGATKSKRSNVGVIGLAIIVIGAGIALWMLMTMLEQMRPQLQDRRPEPAPAVTR